MMEGNFDEDVIVPHKSNKKPIVANTDNIDSPKQKRVWPYIVAVLLIIGIIIAVIILIYQPLNPLTSDIVIDQEEDKPVSTGESLYTTPSDSEDPEGDFLNYLEEKKEASKDEDSKFDSDMEIIGFQIISERYEEAETALSKYDPNTLSAQHQFQLYNVYMNLYRATENQAKFDEYNILSSDARKRIATGE